MEEKQEKERRNNGYVFVIIRTQLTSAGRKED